MTYALVFGLMLTRICYSTYYKKDVQNLIRNESGVSERYILLASDVQKAPLVSDVQI